MSRWTSARPGARRGRTGWPGALREDRRREGLAPVDEAHVVGRGKDLSEGVEQPGLQGAGAPLGGPRRSVGDAVAAAQVAELGDRQVEVDRQRG